MTNRPVLYSFRRCPYAMRARLAIFNSGIQTELREVVLRDKPPSMIEASPKATVPVLVLPDETVLEESTDIMFWALEQNDPDLWLLPWHKQRDELMALIRESDGPFKHFLDRYKYPGRYPDENIEPDAQRTSALEILAKWNDQLKHSGWFFGGNRSIADVALQPFVRQFAHVDRDWFFAQSIPHVHGWLEGFLNWDLFADTMKKYPQWQEGEKGVLFPA